MCFPTDQIEDVLYEDLVADPIGTVVASLRHDGAWSSPTVAASNLREYVAARHSGHEP